MTTSIFGIRHHGPGSARSLRSALKSLQPDIILIEGPPEANDLLALAQSTEMKPPVAVLVYDLEDLQQAAYYPFAIYSPEWQAIQYAVSAKIPVRFIDLPAGMRGELERDKTHPGVDPLGLLSQAAGFGEGERYWEYLVEQRRNSTDLFAAILEAMTALRQELAESTDKYDLIREAYMRQCLRQSQAEGFQKLAVVCGAWHAPALVEPLPAASEDKAQLPAPTKAKIQATWVPWTYGRLSAASGYGAGVESPGWYHHLWTHQKNVVIRWLTNVARLLRKEDIDASSASVIEAVRLAETLAAMRESPLPGLAEVNEAVQTVLCFGDPMPMQLIHQQLIINDRLGQVPSDTPQVPLQQDLQKLIKKLRLKQEPIDKTLELDLRNTNDLDRSQLFHRLNLLDLPWGKTQRTSSTGTFKEGWLLCWHPEFAVKLIEAGVWGNSIASAATAFARQTAQDAQDLPTLTTLLDRVLLASLDAAIPILMQQLQAIAAITSDTLHFMNALPPLANILRYGDVRQTDTTSIAIVVDGLITRLCIGLPNSCQSLDDDAAQQIFDAIGQTNSTIKLLQNSEQLANWRQVLLQIASQQNVHGLVQGRCCRLLFDDGSLDTTATSQRLSLALSLANEPTAAAAWAEGFLRGSGLLLLHSDGIWQVLDEWIAGLSADNFVAVLPLLRRTFATFSSPERQQMGEKVAKGQVISKVIVTESDNFNIVRSRQSLPVVAQLLGFA
ncbi:DUF5682 family protein [Chamaesiphon sp. VAR_48_metabat_403]|uniref:DUF5682 family protein n=1 Tax=Chamaesiphon sp. VAR_48_metabat_403 TaxID=2964700 RepID=UPI00286DA9D3|nr:DUF5682 family protein [Chamaesiphon sp. VAR_48_metabat_403]